jgi:hypothetical protein
MIRPCTMRSARGLFVPTICTVPPGNAFCSIVLRRFRDFCGRDPLGEHGRVVDRRLQQLRG